MKTAEILFSSRAAVLKAEAEAKLLDKQIELEKLRRSDDEALLRQALEALDPPEHLRFGGTGRLKAAAIAALRERLNHTKGS